MSSLNHLSHAAVIAFFTLTMSQLGSSAELIQQPASMLPWQPVPSRLANHRLDELEPVAQPTKPAWLLEDRQRISNDQSLPMVETDRYAEIGVLPIDPPTQRKLATQRQRAGSNKPARSFGLLRALGFQGRQSTSR